VQHDNSIIRSFGPRAEAYLTSEVHSQGKDLSWLANAVATTEHPAVLDLGCGAGHASFAVAPFAQQVTSYDLTQSMLDIVATTARERRIAHITTQQGSVDHLPFDDSSFDWVVSRYSAHHWHNVQLALTEVKRVLKPGGRICFIDIVGGPQPLLDTHLQAVEVLRDPSHVRNYMEEEWLALFQDAFLSSKVVQRWRLPIKFASWISRIGTPEDRVAAITSLWSGAPTEVKKYFNVQADLSFELDVAMFQSHPRKD
jgi:ubiquinone/menaquinone biosynthesis C-methylase UbiE